MIEWPEPDVPTSETYPRYVPDKLNRPAFLQASAGGPLQTLTSSRPWGGAFAFLVRLAPSPLEPNNPSQINWRPPGRSTVLDRAALAVQVRPKGGARSKPRLASVRVLDPPSCPELACRLSPEQRRPGRQQALTVCHQNISDGWRLNLRECLAHRV
jgi:hypothetical protein